MEALPTVLSGGMVTLGARTSAGTVLVKIGSRVYALPALEGLKGDNGYGNQNDDLFKWFSPLCEQI